VRGEACGERAVKARLEDGLDVFKIVGVPLTRLFQERFEHLKGEEEGGNGGWVGGGGGGPVNIQENKAGEEAGGKRRKAGKGAWLSPHPATPPAPHVSTLVLLRSLQAPPS
jgi:hypothetical protein